MEIATSLSRRTCLTALAVALASPPATIPSMTPLDELIADWLMANEEAEALNAEADRILAAADLPTVEVQVRSRRFSYPDQIRDSFDPLIAAWENDRLGPEFAPPLRRQRDDLIAELQRQETARRDAERACGLTSAEALADNASARARAICREIFAWRPTSMEEVATKNAWLLRQVRDGINLQGDLELILGGVSSSAMEAKKGVNETPSS